MDLLTAPVAYVFEFLGEEVVVGETKTKGVVTKEKVRNESSDYIFEEKTTLFVPDSVPTKVGVLVNYRSEVMRVTTVKNERGYKRLGLRCAKEAKLETISL